MKDLQVKNHHNRNLTVTEIKDYIIISSLINLSIKIIDLEYIHRFHKYARIIYQEVYSSYATS